MTITVSPEPLSSPDGRRLTADLEVFLASLYPPGTDFGDVAEDLGGRGVFLVAREDGVAVGCGALRSQAGAAQRLYESAGYAQIDGWDRSGERPHSICFEKTLPRRQ